MRTITQLIKNQGVIFSLLVMFSFSTFAQKASGQKIKPDPRLYEVFSQEYIDGLMNNPRLLAYYNFYLDHACFIASAQEKPLQGVDIHQVRYAGQSEDGVIRYFDENLSTFNLSTFNVLKYDFPLSPDRYSNFLLGNTGKALIFYPMNDFSARYKAYLTSINLPTE